MGLEDGQVLDDDLIDQQKALAKVRLEEILSAANLPADRNRAIRDRVYSAHRPSENRSEKHLLAVRAVEQLEFEFSQGVLACSPLASVNVIAVVCCCPGVDAESSASFVRKSPVTPVVTGRKA